jgi:hypothetical protein
MRPLLLAILPAAVIAAAAPKYTLKSDSSVFVDDPFALRADGKAIAWIATDGANLATLHLSELGGTDTKIDQAPTSATTLRWLSPTRVLVIWREPESQALYAQSFNASGAEKERLGPAELIDLATLDGKPAVLTYARIDSGRAVEHRFAAFRPDTLKPLAKKTLKEDKEGMVPHTGGPFHPLWVEHDLTTLMVKREGQYDKSRDMKRPDRLARFDVFSGKLHDEQEIADLIQFVHVNAAHGHHPGEDRFAYVSDDHAKLLIIDGAGEREITLPHALSLYDLDSLRYQPLDGGKLALSFTVDPMNPRALEKKHADPAVLHLYAVDGSTVTPRFQLDTGDRPASWQLLGNQLVVLRKSKGYDRGGVALEVYDLP